VDSDDGGADTVDADAGGERHHPYSGCARWVPTGHNPDQVM
jgi:hypothetical protein